MGLGLPTSIRMRLAVGGRWPWIKPDLGEVIAISRWLSAATPPVRNAHGTFIPKGLQRRWHPSGMHQRPGNAITGGVAALNHRLMAAVPAGTEMWANQRFGGIPPNELATIQTSQHAFPLTSPSLDAKQGRASTKWMPVRRLIGGNPPKPPALIVKQLERCG